MISNFSCEIEQWDSDDPVPRSELLKKVAGIQGLYCLLTEKIDKELLDAAGRIFKSVLPLSLLHVNTVYSWATSAHFSILILLLNRHDVYFCVCELLYRRFSVA